jgi:hypothetical protein
MSNGGRPQKLVDGKLQDLTDDEIAQRAVDQAEWEKDNPQPAAKDEPHGNRRAK